MNAKPMITAGVPEVHLPGFHLPARRLKTGFVVQEVDYRDDPAHDEAWAARAAIPYGGMGSVKWLQNEERLLTRGGVPVYGMLRDAVHIRRTLTRAEIESAEWCVWRSLDHGIRHPTCVAWFAINRDGDRIFFRQYYQTDYTIAMNCQAVLAQSPEEVAGTVADPSVWQRDPLTLEVWADVYAREGLPLMPADNSRRGYEAVTSGLVAALARFALWKNDLDILREAMRSPGIDLALATRLSKLPAVWFTPQCASGPLSLYEQCRNFRWKEFVSADSGRAAPEDYQDVDDEGPDVVRYAVQTQAVRWQAAPKPKKDIDVVRLIVDKSMRRQTTQ